MDKRAETNLVAAAMLVIIVGLSLTSEMDNSDVRTNAHARSDMSSYGGGDSGVAMLSEAQVQYQDLLKAATSGIAQCADGF